MNLNPDRIRQILTPAAGLTRPACPPLPGVDPSPQQPAAVLIPLLQDQGVWKLLFIKRTVHPNDRHSGQIAFPGGSYDPSDQDLEQTALREAAEEIGLDPSAVQILGRSCSLITVTGYEVTPFAGIVAWPFTLKLAPQEVERVLLIPLEWLGDPANRRTEPWAAGGLPQAEFPVIFFEEFEGEVLWGATARILVDFLELIQFNPSSRA